MGLSELKYEPDHYLAFVLNEKTRTELIKLFPPTFDKVFCHHVTVDFRLNRERLDEIKEKISDEAKLSVTGYVVGEGVECFTVEIDKKKHRPDNGFYHVTHSVQPPAKPVDSNKLLNSVHGEPSREFHLELEGSFKLLKR